MFGDTIWNCAGWLSEWISLFFLKIKRQPHLYTRNRGRRFIRFLFILTEEGNQFFQHGCNLSSFRGDFSECLLDFCSGGNILHTKRHLSSTLKTKQKKLSHAKQESLRIKVLYSRLRRSINHSQMKQNLAQHVAEHIWRYGKEYKMLDFLYWINLLFFTI